MILGENVGTQIYDNIDNISIDESVLSHIWLDAESVKDNCKIIVSDNVTMPIWERISTPTRNILRTLKQQTPLNKIQDEIR